MSNPETALKRAVIDAINATGLAVVWNSPVGAARRGRIRMAPKGTPDVIGYLRDGRLLAIECKMPNDRTEKTRRESQQAWRDRAQSAGCVVGVVRSVAEAVAVVTQANGRAA